MTAHRWQEMLTAKTVSPQETDEKCHKCGSPMVVKMGRRGKFLACSGYPNCKNIIGLDKQGIVDIAVNGAKLCRKLEQTVPGTDIRYEYSPESFTLSIRSLPDIS